MEDADRRGHSNRSKSLQDGGRHSNHATPLLQVCVTRADPVSLMEVAKSSETGVTDTRRASTRDLLHQTPDLSPSPDSDAKVIAEVPEKSKLPEQAC